MPGGPLPSLLLPFHGGGNALLSTALLASQAEADFLEAKELGGQALQVLWIGAQGKQLLCREVILPK